MANTRLLPRLLAGDPFPPQMDVKLRYCWQNGLSTPGVGFSGTFGTEQVFRLNSLFDPDLTGTGHQPFGFDQLTPIYGRYVVSGVDVDIEFFNSNSDDLIAAFTIQSGQNTTALAGSTIESAVERQSVMVRSVPTTGQNRWKYTEHFPIHAIEGQVPGIVYRDDAYQSLVNSSPINQCYLRLAAACSVANGKLVQCQVVLTYHARFLERISMGQS